MIAILVIAIVVFFLIGMPIAFAIGAGSTIAILWDGTLPISIVAQRMFFGLDSWLLMAIPLFMLAGQLMAAGGMSSRLVAFTTELFGFIRGSLGFVCVAASMTFAGVSGSSTADTAAVGSIILPLMKERGYDMRFATALQAAAGSIGPVIPPSLLMILIGLTTNTSVSALFLGGIVPGLLIGLGLMVVTYLHAARGGPAYLGTQTHVDFRRVVRTGLVAAPALGMPVIILVGIVGGIFTTTEAAVVAVVYGLGVGMFVYREISL
ncbi:MAG: TRAP transporter large permease, partial [Acidobacteriota bacterium]|nr:TRAP transporter large permease [Acidobacteriota bacterium]